MSRAANVRLKEAIAALCRVLAELGINPETFRQAKFNRPEATAEFWKLLCCLLKKIHGDRTSDPNNENIGTQIRFVKSVLWYYGYGNLDFYRLPDDGSQGSRELLLVFSWLLHKNHLLEKLLEVNRIRVGDEISVCMCKAIHTARHKIKEETISPFSRQGETDVRYLQWLNGKLRFCWRTLHAAQQEECAILHKIHSYTRGCHTDQNISHLSVTETDLLRQPENCNKESVLDCKLEDARYLQSQDSRNGNSLQIADFCHGNSHIIDEIEKLNSSLVALHDELQEVLSCKKSSWNEKIRAREKDVLNMKEFCVAVMKIEQEVKKKMEEFKYQCAHNKAEMHGSYRLVFKDSKSGIIRSVSKQPGPDAVRAREVIGELQRKEVEMEKELNKLQEECRRKLDVIAGGMDGVICIPPTKTQMDIKRNVKDNLS
ncbi:tubulin epsilon and delta complex protein 1 isoform X2 [Rhinatrema bivittatum]|uniref:tubulin epsilon and delta complex protein 1 isoform X2 n=1 Tax=Rhinatrema bivittatum TaxID=194408 RepID=UPI001127367D|nr:tubulin epsilon and delta complex protein 1 isoform X2 [Rhinatrema bivittatum]